MSCRGLVRPIRADLLAGVPLRPGSFDALLLDAPCSGLGMIGRHPEARWNRDARMIAKLAERQQRLLAAVAELAAPGARLVYSTCSFEKEETIEVIATFLQSGAPFRLAPIRDVLPPEVTALSLSEDWLLVLPEGGLRSGYFAALLERTR
jgi:16S rRNA (cytosine967-C5)-methyltransferase